MRGIVISVLMIIWWGVGVAQKHDSWRDFAKPGEIPENSNLKEQVFMVEASLKQLYNYTDQYKILRSFDQNHHIVRGVPAGDLGKKWEVDDQWKLSYSTEASSEYYYLVIADSFNESELDEFEVVRRYPSRNTLLIQGSLKKIKELLLPNPDVLHVTNKTYQPTVESRVIDMNLNPNRVNKVHHNYPLLNGSTETVSIQENRFDTEDIDLLGRSIASGLESELMDNHATEMTTIIAGAGNSFITGSGVATKAKITSSDFIDAMPDGDHDYIGFNINTQNHSYGIPRVSEYGVEAHAFDQSAYQNKNLLHVFSSGNEGQEVSSDGVYDGVEGFANLTGNIKMSKNSLVVGSADTVGNVPAFVSRGPTYDGRVKPEVVAYSVVGSSNSAALVSGIATLLQQQYREDNSAGMPSALAKALIINGTDDVGPEGLDFLTGYGNVNAWKSLEALRNDQYFSGSVMAGNTSSFDLNLPADAVNLKVILCWTDPAANVNDFPALVNNLDLRLVEGANTTLPWILDESPNETDLAKPAARGIDNLNNTEQVTIENPEINYSIEVEGSVVNGSQEFFIAWQYDLEDTFEWDFPTGSDNMPYNGETGSYFRWNTTKSGTAELSYTIDDITWTILDESVDLERGYWRWNNPPQIFDEVRARIKIGVDEFETEVFTVSEPLAADVGFNCSDSLLLKWDRSPQAVDYTVYNLGSESLEEYITVPDTFLVVQSKSALPSTRFSIQPNLASGKGLLPTPTFDYTLQGIECYVFSFFQTTVLDTGIYLNLSLGTTYGIERIVFERNELSSFNEIGSITEVNSASYEFLDDTPNQGYNEHLVTIFFINGEEITLSAGTSYYLTKEPLRIFPNPIQAGEPFTIITKEFEDRTPQLELLDSRGSLVHKQTVQGSLDVIPTEGIRSGIYFYRLRADGEMYSGRLLVR